MKILICTGIYPPKTSGPAQYAEKMNNLWSKMGNRVVVKTYTIENYLPTGLRHLFYFLKILPSVLSSDAVFCLDTFSVGFPAVLACSIFGKKNIIRTGGDFLWEGYVERTGDTVLLRDFYDTRLDKLSIKEKIIFDVTKWTLNNTSLLVFSTDWQRNIFLKPYSLDLENTIVIENHYDKIIDNNLDNSDFTENKNFVAGTRPLKWKNISTLKKVFSDNEILSAGAVLDLESASHADFLKKISNSYAVILVSLGDISPHMIIDAISLNKPFIVTIENGIMNRIGDIAITVDPKNEEDIKQKILWLLEPHNYKQQVQKIQNFSFIRAWDDLAIEYIKLFEKI